MNQIAAHATVASEPHIPFPTVGSYPARHGNSVRPLVDSGPTFRRICEAIDAARHSVWLMVTFMAPDFQMPDGRGTVLDVLDRAVARGLDVRVIFWRPNPESSGYGLAFSGSQANRDMLRARGSRFRARWDRAHGPYVQHQKGWLIDAGQSSETAFIGGNQPDVWGLRVRPRWRVSAPRHLCRGDRAVRHRRAPATIGSCNLHRYSLFGNTEMNATFWDPRVVRELRCQLFAEHLGLDTSHLHDRVAVRLYRSVANENRRRQGAGSSDWQGLAFSLPPTTYGREVPDRGLSRPSDYQ